MDIIAGVQKSGDPAEKTVEKHGLELRPARIGCRGAYRPVQWCSLAESSRSRPTRPPHPEGFSSPANAPSVRHPI